MTIASASPCKKMVRFGVSLFRGGFKSSKCKTMAKLATARIKLLRNKREVVVKQMRRDVALLLQSGQDATARIRVEHVIREQNIMAANEIIELFCELIVARLSIIAKQRECPADLKEGICSLIFSAPRCADIPELLQIRDIFEKKYGKDFVSAATDLRPDCGVNRALIEKLSVRTPNGEVKLKLMKEIAKEYQIEWDTTESEKELLKPPEELIEGPRKFVSATSMPVKPVSSEGVEQNLSSNRLTSSKEADATHFKDMASAAKAAAESAEKAIAAAQAAAYLANRDTYQVSAATGFSNSFDGYGNQLSSKKHLFSNSLDPMATDALVISQENRHHSKLPGRMCESQSFDRSHYLSDEESGHIIADNKRIHRRHSYNVPKAAQSDIQFDESDESDSDCDEEIEMETPAGVYAPPNRPPPIPPSHASQPDDRLGGAENSGSSRRNSIPGVHPKLPDYDTLAARFEALKLRKS
ncbi:protein of unknown function DUF292 [Macleaya cordata]|uniref:IST1-like protein n=1 Tax=Macleaya cordata TaxID=56857 RepID=A0A200QZZ0_MACCD|nr:protein of unknown function DUF292 [Macleaya cordata]